MSFSPSWLLPSRELFSRPLVPVSFSFSKQVSSIEWTAFLFLSTTTTDRLCWVGGQTHQSSHNLQGISGEIGCSLRSRFCSRCLPRCWFRMPAPIGCCGRTNWRNRTWHRWINKPEPARGRRRATRRRLIETDSGISLWFILLIKSERRKIA